MVNTREIAEEYRLTHWAQIMRERQDSGLSIAAYCRQIGICGNTYFYWQRRVRAAVLEISVDSQQPSVVKPQGKAVSANKAPAPSGWALCEVAKPQSCGKALPIEIGKFRVLADADVDAELLTKVCKTLVSLC